MNNTANETVISDGTENAITAVTLFSHQAYVTRQVKTEVAAGIQQLSIEILALKIDPNSVQAKVFGQGELLSVQHKELPTIKAPQEAIQDFDEQLRQKKREKQRLLNAREIIEKQRRLLDTTLDYAQVQIPREIKTHFPTAAQLQEISDFLEQGYTTLADRDEKLAIELDELDRTLHLIERKRKKLQQTKHPARSVIELLFHAQLAQSLRIELAYTVFDAHWLPYYKADVAADLSGLQLTRLAQIQQQSGEDWQGVQLTLSTARLLGGAALPEAKPWLLKKPLPDPFAFAVPMAAAASVELNELEMLEGATAPAPVAEAEQRTLPTAFEYQLPLAVDVPSSNDETLLTLGSQAIEGRFYHHCVPKIDPHSYLVCETPANPELLPGQLNVHFAGRFVASTQINAQSAGEPLRFNLGADQSVQVKREQLIDKTAETFFGRVDRSHSSHELAYRITIENRHQEPIKLALFDTVPSSKTDRYLVSGIELTPEPSERDWNGQTGVMRWQLELKPQEKQTVQVRFMVKYPRNERPQGI